MAYQRQLSPRQLDPPAGNDPRKWGAKCDLCPLKGARPVFGDGPNRPLLAVIGEAPGIEESKIGLPFIGKSGEYLESLLKFLGVKRTDVLISNAISCFPPGGDLTAFLQRAKKETKEAKMDWHSPIDCCRPRLFHELGVPVCKRCQKYVRSPDKLVCRCKSPSRVLMPWMSMPAVTVPLGNAALESVLGLTGITERRGYPEDMVKRRGRLVQEKVTGMREAGGGKLSEAGGSYK